MQQTGLVSVVIPTYNAAHYLPEAIESICRQTVLPHEIIVIDDGSTDITPTLIKELPDDIRYVRQENAGPAAARNRGIRLARGEIIAFLDADDWWPHDKLARQLPHLTAESVVSIVSGQIRYVPMPGVPMPDIVLSKDNTVSHVHLGAALFHRSVFERVGLFNEALRFSEDMDWYLRAREAGETIKILRDVTLNYRIHAGNMTNGRGAADLKLTEVLRMSLARRRGRHNDRQSNLKAWSSFQEDGQENER